MSGVKGRGKGPENKPSEVKRDKHGRVMKGSASPNPGGQPKWVKSLRDQLEAAAPDAVTYLSQVVRGEKFELVVEGETIHVPPSHDNRIRASEVVLAYSVAKPKQSLEVDGAEGLVVQVVKYMGEKT